MALSHNRIHHGDCVKLLGQVKEGSVDLVFADPPFNIGYEYDVYDDAKQSEDYLQWCRQWIDGVHKALKPDGTFWLAIGDEYAAELKIESQKAGFHCRSWVIWYYTFGVNCRNGFSRSHTHLFHFVKDLKEFTFSRPNPQIRVKSARQLVYADNRANPDGRLPDNTWIIRPQDAPTSFSPNHDTWYFARVAGTFKEREGFHGCQMPEQLLARIIRASSRPNEIVLDPFGGSGTTLCVAKKLARRYMGFELSEEYVKYITERLDRTAVGDPIDGPEDPIQSAPSTAKGKRRKKPFDEKTEAAVISAYQKASQGYPAEYLLCDAGLKFQIHRRMQSQRDWGQRIRVESLPAQSAQAIETPALDPQPAKISAAALSRYGFASEVAWRLLAIDYRKTLDDILCSPEFAQEFDRLAAMFGPVDVTPIEYRRAALSIRKRTKKARETAAEKFGDWMKTNIRPIAIDKCLDAKYEIPGVFVIRAGDAPIYAGESENIRQHIEHLLENEHWQDLEPTTIILRESAGSFVDKYAQKSALIHRDFPLLNCRLWVSNSELPA